MSQVITDLVARKAVPPAKGQRTIWDQGLPNFGLRISQGGTRSWVVQYGPTRQLTTIGRYPLISVADARAEAKRILAERTLGKTRPVTISFDEAKRQFLEACALKNKPRTVADYTRYLSLHFKFGATKLAEISAEEIRRRIDKLKKTPSEQSHAFVAIKIFLRWAVKSGMLERSPIEQMSIPVRQEARERAPSGEEIAAVYDAARKTPHPYGTIIQLLILTGQRRGEIAALRWSWIDQEAKTITLPASITKNRRQHTFPYGGTVQSLLEAIPVEKDVDYLFPASRSNVRGKPTTTFNGWGKPKVELDKQIAARGGEPLPPWTLHDLRRTFATALASLQTPVHVTEKLLNHVSGTVSGVAAIYNRHTYMDEMRQAVEAFESYLHEQVAALETRPRQRTSSLLRSARPRALS